MKLLHCLLCGESWPYDTDTDENAENVVDVYKAHQCTPRDAVQAR